MEGYVDRLPDDKNEMIRVKFTSTQDGKPITMYRNVKVKNLQRLFPLLIMVSSTGLKLTLLFVLQTK